MQSKPAQTSADAAAVRLPQPLFLFLLLSAGLTCLAILFSFFMRSLHLGLPYSFPYYLVPNDMGGDLRGFTIKFSTYPTIRFYSGDAGYFMYPLPLFFLLRPIFMFGHSFYVFVALLLGLTSVLVYSFVRAMQAACMGGRTLALFVSSTVLLSYPLAFEFQRSNVEIVLFGLVACGLIAWWCDKPILAAFFFGIAGSCKIYPLMFAGLLFSERRWRAVAFTFFTAAVCTLGAAWAFGPTIHDALTWDSFQIGLFQKRFAGLAGLQLGYDHSFFGLLKFFTLPWHPSLGPWVPIYTRIAAVSALLLYFLRIRRLPRLNQVLILTILSVTLPPVSYDYTLLAVYAPLVLLSMETARRAYAGVAPFPYATRYFVLFGILLTPLSFLTWFSNPHHAQARCICLIVLVWTALRHPIEPIRLPRSTVPAHTPAFAQ